MPVTLAIWEARPGGLWFQASLGKKVCRAHLNRKAGSYSGKHKLRGLRSRLVQKKAISYLLNNQSKKGWRHGSKTPVAPKKKKEEHL
jgi:hypothetical protein